MAAAHVSMPGTRGTNLEFADYSLYSNLSDDELMQLAIERSLADGQSSGPRSENSNNPTALNMPTVPRQAPPTHRPQQQLEPAACPANPPRENPQGVCSVGHFVTGSGKRMVAYRRYDGTMQVVPEPQEELAPIVKAILEGDVGTVRLLVKQPGCNVLAPNKDGWIPLHEAAYYGQDQCIKILLRAQPGMVNQRTLKGKTALMFAVSRDHLACVESLLENGADPDISNMDRETPLYKACEKENPAMVAMLLNYGASVNKNCIQGWTALHESVCRNNVEICEMLVKAGAKVNMPNMYGITPIFVAAQSGKVDALRMLLKNGADLNSQAADGATALYEACKNGHDEIVEFLLSQNADANKPGKTGLMPIHIAAQRGNDCKDLGRTLKNTRETNIVSMLIPATSKARVRRSGVSPLHLAAERNRNDILELLIEAGFDVNATLSDDRSMMYEDRRSTALYFAVMNNNIDATTMLLEAGANPNLDTFNPLLVALRQGCIQTVTMLVKHGANVNAYIPTHPTAFPAAVMFCMKHLTLLKYMMDNGCDALLCFNCVYGRNPHPPIKIRRNLRYDSDETVEKTCVQFCELISTETYSHWAGPIIDVLLDYVGHVKLCARLIEHLDSYDEWQCIKEKSTPPRPLMQLCRLKIRKLLGINRLKKICKLPVPPRLIKFLNHQEREIDF
ncbi:ankyrin repeat and SOCS box protein 2 isoform X1 [Megalobrama amblycephala]|uniref:ankyrin repeat and SOCS box protein 2 isoform X1 n=1 Tax=Megalobrama amblycephala TaxID=75352 RepID=UPI002013E189|nr:ankyrin repeat and SOCS box protein 2 isoform X1 [Megalobrama amblycephala]XP_048062495.1 ankyrin repeat and SOCS box protein 2 isoform X1 [Megalobrama amblycephala]XP_048062496.1 ankyrin repeat and SOCS box protein 2 isoform X1 [Megalobrama amblycephala]